MQRFLSKRMVGGHFLFVALVASQLAGCGADTAPMSEALAVEAAVEGASYTEDIPAQAPLTLSSSKSDKSRSGSRSATTTTTNTPTTSASTPSSSSAPTASTNSPTVNPGVASSDSGVDTTGNATSPSTAAILSSSDPRVAYWVDPRLSFASLRQWEPIKQVYGQNSALADVPEPGILGAGNDYTLSRTRDPLNTERAAFRHRIAEAFPTWGDLGSRRSEISANWTGNGTAVLRGIDYWVAFAIKFEPDVFGAGNGMAELLDFHQVPDDGENWLPSSLAMYVGEDFISFAVRWDSSQPSIAANPPGADLWSERNPTTAQWHRFVMKLRLHWDRSKGPYVKIWRAVGNGPLQQIADYAGPNDYNNIAPYVPQKFGLYRWDAWSGKPTRTIFTKGFYVFKDQTGSPAINEQTLNQLLGQI